VRYEENGENARKMRKVRMVRARVGVSRIGSDGWKEGKNAVRTRPGRREHVHRVRRYKEDGENRAEKGGETKMRIASD
jgi:hypothetical protein